MCGKKQGAGNKDSNLNSKAKAVFEAQSREIRATLSKAKAEMERIKANRKLTKKGKKKRAQLMGEYKSISVANLVSYMEKQKSVFRKLELGYRQGVKRVLYSYKILYFQTCPIKSYKLSKCPIFSYILGLLAQNFQKLPKK